jgi:hypothetical protein
MLPVKELRLVRPALVFLNRKFIFEPPSSQRRHRPHPTTIFLALARTCARNRMIDKTYCFCITLHKYPNEFTNQILDPTAW